MLDEPFDPDAEDDESPDDDTDDTPVIRLTTAVPIQIERRRLPDDPELAPDSAIVGTYLDGRLIARSAAPAEWTPEAEGGVFATPRHLHYRGRDAEGGALYAELGALLPASALPREPWQPEPDDTKEPPALALLGVVIRLAQDRKQEDLMRECLDHFATIVGEGAEPVADRVLRSL